MADVTISGLPTGTPTSNNFIPISNGSSTFKSTINQISAPIGTVIYANSAPNENWLRCQNQLLNISQFPDLFASLSNIYGGDGISTFRLPPSNSLLNTNTIVSQFPGAYNCGKGTLLNDGRIMYGGHQSADIWLGTISGETVTWINCSTKLPASRDGANLTTLPDGRVLLYGGSNDRTLLITAEPSNISYIDASPNTLPVTMGHPVQGWLPDGRLVVVSTQTLIGTINGNNISWVVSTSCPSDRNTGGGGILPDGRIFVTGGPANNAAASSAHIGTVTGNTISWTEVSRLPTSTAAGYYVRTGIVLPDGRYFQSGGGSASGSEIWTATVINNSVDWKLENYDPYGRYLATAVPLSNDRVFIFSGNGSPGSFISRFYLYSFIKVT